jgi:hypothetical protein
MARKPSPEAAPEVPGAVPAATLDPLSEGAGKALSDRIDAATSPAAARAILKGALADHKVPHRVYHALGELSRKKIASLS